MSSTLAASLHERLLVRRMEEGDGEILIPDTAKRRPWKGEVLAVGNDKDPGGGKRGALDVKVGDKVLFGKYSGIEVTVNGEDLLVLSRSPMWWGDTTRSWPRATSGERWRSSMPREPSGSR